MLFFARLNLAHTNEVRAWISMREVWLGSLNSSSKNDTITTVRTAGFPPMITGMHYYVWHIVDFATKTLTNFVLIKKINQSNMLN